MQPLFTELVKKHLSGTITDSEKLTLSEMLDSTENQAILERMIDLDFSNNEIQGLSKPGKADVLYNRIAESLHTEQQQVAPVRRMRYGQTPWARYAAAVLLFAVAGAWLWLQYGNNKSQTPSNRSAQIQTDIAPGRDGAILTLADGKQVVLDSLANGIVANENGTQVMLKDGALAYDAAGKSTAEIVYNTMRTPKGRQFQLQLPDGTNIWLNAASSIRYPTRFAGAERRVEIEGEVYFEVAKNPAMPFKVKINEQTEVEVLGTHFNINAYKNETSVKTTLVEGLVRVNAYSNWQMLKPGQQAIVKPGQKTSVINDADIDKILAWKNGLFNFEDAGIEEVMRQVERWYDIEVVYESGVPGIQFGGGMSRNISLSGVLKALEKTRVHFRLEGRRLVVMQ